MSCFHPLKAFKIGVNPDTGKDILKITPYAVDHIEFCRDRWEMSEWHAMSQRASKVVRDFKEIPCGTCQGCCIDKSREWANRMMLELQDHDSAYFITLTYDELHVPETFYPDPDTGEAIPVMTLNPRDPQLWLKRLRKAFPDDHIRYFLCGEYGSSTHRPHYHAIVFGLHLDDLVPLNGSKEYFTSTSLQRTWSTISKGNYAPLGFVLVAAVTWQSCAYVARYVTKKLYGKEREFYEIHNLCPEFTRMSRKPGLAFRFYEEHPECVRKPYLYLSTEEKGIKFTPPKAFFKKFSDQFPEEAKEIKERRMQFAIEAKKAKLANTDLSYEEYLTVQESNFKARIKSLLRDKI